VLLTAVSTTYILSSAVILECLKDFHQEDSQKNNLFLEPTILKTSKAPFQTRHYYQRYGYQVIDYFEKKDKPLFFSPFI
jgi:hypothetical protein